MNPIQMLILLIYQKGYLLKKESDGKVIKLEVKKDQKVY